jgi:hypothetical protein
MNVFVKNNCAAPSTTWNVQFDLPTGTAVSSSWSSSRTQSGQHFTFTNVSYNGAIASGQEQSFGFNATGLGLPADLTVR